MSALRSSRARILRFELSPRYLRLQRRRTESTSSNPPPPPTSQPPPHKHSSFFRRHRSTIIWSTLSLIAGISAGQLVVHTISPPPLPAAGTREDSLLLADLHRRIDAEFKVKVLRGKCLGVTKRLKGEEGGWFEVIPHPTTTEVVDEKKSDPLVPEEGLLIDQMQGARGLGVERVFWDQAEGKLVAVVWFGAAVCGWPGVVHGGCLATSIEEKLALAAALADRQAGGDVLAAAPPPPPQRLPGTGNHAKMLAPAPSSSTLLQEPTHLSLGYVKPTYANQFYVIRVKPALPLPPEESTSAREGEREVEWEATLEKQDGSVCVQARGRFAGSRRGMLRGNGDEGVRGSYEDFRKWMWPSRQEQSWV